MVNRSAIDCFDNPFSDLILIFFEPDEIRTIELLSHF